MSSSVWYNLPALVLLIIFEHGTYDTLQDEGLPFALLVSHVCKGWRATAASSPSVWCAIPIHPRRTGLLQYSMARNGDTLPLDLCYHLTGSHALIRDMLSLGTSQPERIRSICLRAQDGVAVYMFISQLIYQSFQRLTHFEINLAKTTKKRTLGPLIQSILYYNPPSRLSSVIMHGVSFHFQHRMLRGLTQLTLADLPRELFTPSYATFRDLLSSSPQLEYLKLDGVFPVLVQDFEYGGITLPALHTLELVMDHPSSYVSDFFLVLCAPNVHTLSFQTSWPITAEGFDDALGILRASFERLRTLRLSLYVTRMLREDGVQPRLFDAFPELRFLTLAAHSDRVVLHYLEPWIACHAEGNAVWPQLELLTVRSPFGDLEPDGEASCVDDALELLADLRESASLPFDVWQEYVVPQVVRL